MTDTSGDLIADRRFAWALASAAEADHAGAADLLEQVLARVPDWAPAWAALADARENLGSLALATEAWCEVARCDKEARLGAPLHLARLAGQTPAAMPEGYVTALFDDYAPRFDRHLAQDLGYRGPALLIAAIEAVRPAARFVHALDLGCGTGLMGLALRDRAARIDGNDLSPNMVAHARQRGVYHDLAVGPLQTTLARAAPQTYDLVTAADVLVYVGELRPVLAEIGRVLRPGGLFAASFQAWSGVGAFSLGADLRFSHAAATIAAAVEAAGLGLLLQREASTRTEKGRDVPGFVMVAVKLS